MVEESDLVKILLLGCVLTRIENVNESLFVTWLKPVSYLIQEWDNLSSGNIICLLLFFKIFFHFYLKLSWLHIAFLFY